MKIGVVIDRLNVGGVEKIAIEEVIALRKLGEDAKLVVLRDKPIVANAFPELLKQIPIVYLDRRLPRILRISFSFPVFNFFSFFHISYPIFLPFVVKKKEFDYFIVHGSYTCLSAISIGRVRNIKLSAFIWDPVSYIIDRVYASKFFYPVSRIIKRLALSLDKFLINNMDNVLVGGPAHNDFIHSINPKKRIVIIYPSVHPSSKLCTKDLYVLMVTAWKDGKNPEYILEIVKNIPEINIKMVGKWLDPNYKLKFEKLVKNSGYEKQIEIVGSVSENKLQEYYAKALVLLQTNDDKGFGMPAMEAAGCGTTFIIPRGQGVCSLFVNHKDGFYVKEKDTKENVRLLKLLLSDKKLATNFGETAWVKVKNNYSWDKHAQELRRMVSESLTIKC